jgi:hypothetical protein
MVQSDERGGSWAKAGTAAIAATTPDTARAVTDFRTEPRMLLTAVMYHPVLFILTDVESTGGFSMASHC